MPINVCVCVSEFNKQGCGLFVSVCVYVYSYMCMRLCVCACVCLYLNFLTHIYDVLSVLCVPFNTYRDCLRMVRHMAGEVSIKYIYIYIQTQTSRSLVHALCSALDISPGNKKRHY